MKLNFCSTSSFLPSYSYLRIDIFHSLYNSYSISIPKLLRKEVSKTDFSSSSPNIFPNRLVLFFSLSYTFLLFISSSEAQENVFEGAELKIFLDSSYFFHLPTVIGDFLLFYIFFQNEGMHK